VRLSDELGSSWGALPAKQKAQLAFGGIIVVSTLLILLKMATGFGGDAFAGFLVLMWLLSAFVLVVLADLFAGDADLRNATSTWTRMAVVRSYRNDGAGRRKLEDEAATLAKRGYAIQGQTGMSGHINVGRTVAPAVLTGGLSLITGASRSRDKITVTYVRQGWRSLTRAL
jgi:hypothetical protein